MHTSSIRAELEAAQAALDRAMALLKAMEADQQPEPAPPAVAPPSAAPGPLAHPSVFFDAMRAMAPGGKLNENQVAGLDAILGAGRKAALPLAWMAYVIATPALETGWSFDPGKVENLNYSVQALKSKFSRERISLADADRYGRNDATGQRANQQAIANAIYGGAWGLQNLGNTQPNDGWWFRGRSWPQLTGRKNWTKADQALSMGGKLLTNPALIADPAIAAPILIGGMVGGWYTTKKLADYLPQTGPADREQFTDARYIVNGQDRAGDIADIALDIQAALVAGGYNA